ncbi:DUF3027 domain-containing protein [Pseudoglutamicibacter cumminsii]|uniref:DUF3027 domain-containing protein n=1 Tax=Pseudoglutamicibacter cumminsii TaxID=156979 RepID=A0ABX5L6R0_9MICC|nr:DUF3027 domain-containing protein [Pseudoglutamicibacter cumminsii]PWI27806.1 DUF3027 domain-containing protein [Pseudoglutamicibacter cumminsii]
MARKPKLDSVLAEAKAQARDALLENEPENVVGEHIEVVAEDSRVVTHYFECTQDGYAGWRWYVTLARPPRGKTATVSESGLVPGDGALLAPEWVPWEERMRAYKEEQAAKKAAEEAERETQQAYDADEGAGEDIEDASDASGETADAEVDTDADEVAADDAADGGRGNRAARREPLQRRRRQRRRRGRRGQRNSKKN